MIRTRFLGSTYRLQMNALGFEGARTLVPYLHDLGVDTLYLSPIFAAVPGSTHGYDVVDPTSLNSELGTDDDFERLLRELKHHEMRAIIDIVPNHMATHPSNEWWWDVLRNGEQSPTGNVFDIDWSRHEGRVLVPSLSRPLIELLPAASITTQSPAFSLDIDGQHFPLDPATPANGDISTVLRRQHFQPAYWPLGNSEGNYRRFFDIDGLIGVRVEDRDVFDRTHERIGLLARDPRIAGWRVDHVDGLNNPKEYLDRLAKLISSSRESSSTVLVEKILATTESLPSSWKADGTTGYEFANVLGGLFVSAHGAQALALASRELADAPLDFHDLSIAAKREVMETSFAAALERLVLLATSCLDHLYVGHDLSRSQVRAAVIALTEHLDVYRTYRDRRVASKDDLARLDDAIERSTKGATDTHRRAVHFVGELLRTNPAESAEFVERWQQFTGAVMAKGVEDTATYRHVGLLSHAEVGSDPDAASCTPTNFYRLTQRLQSHPLSLNATSTHDSKRSEDARARLYALSEMPEEWIATITKWHRRYRHLATSSGPDTQDELAMYQNILAVWPIDSAKVSRELQQRICDYALKYVREAKRHSSWSAPNQSYERALTSFLKSILRDASFIREMSALLSKIGPTALTTSLSMLTLKCVAPGTPDFYQGSESWYFALTDPDNRRDVDFDALRTLAGRLPEINSTNLSSTFAAMYKRPASGALKLFTTRQLLHLRRREPDLFLNGDCTHAPLQGSMADHAINLSRHQKSKWVLAVVPRQTLAQAKPGRFPLGVRVWGDTTLRLPRQCPSEFRNVFTGAVVPVEKGRLSLATCFGEFPVAVFEN